MSVSPMCPEHNMIAAIKSNIRNKTTGRVYPPFYGCPWKGTDESGATVYCKHRFEEKPSQTEVMQSGTDGARGAVVDKDRQIRFMNALNNATLLAANGIVEISKDKDLWRSDLYEVAKEIYSLKVPD